MTRIPSVAAVASVAALALLSSTAFAWKHVDPRRVYTPDEMPIPVFVADDGAENTIKNCDASGGLSGCCEETVEAGYCYEAAAAGFAEWADTPCTDIRVDVANGTVDPDRASANFFDLNDGINNVVFNNSSNEVAITEAGTLAVTISRTDRSDIAAIINGEPYFRTFGDIDIVFNTGTTFISDPTMQAEGCTDAHNMQSVMTHEIGHFLGMGHSCEQDDPCPDPLLLGATMYWSEGTCSRGAVDINEDDIDGITALYGPSARFACSHQASEDQVIGVVPFELKCVIFSDFISEITQAQWVFGDGGVSDELAATHEYTEPGNYTIQVNVQGESDACGESGWSNDFRRVGYVRACGEPASSFEVVKVDGLDYQLLNDSDVSVFGCISDIQWDVYRGAGTGGERFGEPIKAWEPVVSFDQPGTYTAVMSLGGIGGTGGSMATFEVTRAPGTSAFGCQHSGPAGGVAGLALACLLLLRRRRD